CLDASCLDAFLPRQNRPPEACGTPSPQVALDPRTAAPGQPSHAMPDSAGDMRWRVAVSAPRARASPCVEPGNPVGWGRRRAPPPSNEGGRIMMRRMAIFGVLAVAALATAQTTWHVNGSCGDDTWTGLSELCHAPDGPKATIQAALTAAQAGDIVLVADGEYRGEGNRGLRFDGKAIQLRSTGGAAACLIDVESQGSAFLLLLFEPAGSLVEGFASTGERSSAVWVHHTGEAEFRDCIFRDKR